MSSVFIVWTRVAGAPDKWRPGYDVIRKIFLSESKAKKFVREQGEWMEDYWIEERTIDK